MGTPVNTPALTVLHVSPPDSVLQELLERCEVNIQARTWFAAAADEELSRFEPPTLLRR
jgi:hypothetical protein